MGGLQFPAVMIFHCYIGREGELEEDLRVRKNGVPWQLGLKTRLSGGGKKEQDEAFRKKGQNQSCRKASLQRLGKSDWVRGGGQLGGPSLARSGVAWS